MKRSNFLGLLVAVPLIGPALVKAATPVEAVEARVLTAAEVDLAFAALLRYGVAAYTLRAYHNSQLIYDHEMYEPIEVS
jgi:hypothetical protein